MPACDWLLVGAKTTSNAELAPLLVQIAAPGAKVVLLQNGGLFCCIVSFAPRCRPPG